MKTVLDSRAAWITASAALAIMTIAYGAPLVVVVAMKQIAIELQTNRSEPAGASSLSYVGAAFGGIVASLVDDIIMPIIGAATGGLDFSNYFVPLSHNVNATALAEAKRQGAVFAYGSFLTKLVNFLIIAWVLFLVVKAINRFKRQQEAAPPPKPTLSENLLIEIRDLLRARQREI